MDSNPHVRRLLQSKDDPFQVSESLGRLRLDDSADDDTSSSTPTRLTLPSTQSRVSISDQTLHEVCERLQRYIQPDDSDKAILGSLGTIWVNVNKALKEDPILKMRLADQDKFEENVKSKGEEKFIVLLKDMAKKKNWQDLLENDVFLKPEEPAWNRTPASMDASVRAWGTPFKGQAANVLVNTIANYLDKRRQAYSMQTCILNSSGTGKSRMVHEVATKIITVPMCLRLKGTKGFPPPDVDLRDWFQKLADANSNWQATVAKRLHDFVYSLLTILLNRLEEVESEVKSGERRVPRIPLTYNPQNRASYERLVKERQTLLASRFSNLMTRDMSFTSHNDYRLRFYKDVLNKLEERSKTSEGSNPHSPKRYIYEAEEDVKNAADSLCRFIDLHGVLDSDIGSRWPLVILAFDESHILTEFPERCGWTLFSELRRTLQAIVKQPMFSLFLATAGSFHLFSPEIKSDPSRRVTDKTLRPLDPITEISFDDLAYLAKEDSVSLSRVVATDWISHLGRPLFGVYYDQLRSEDELFEFAKQKLLDGGPELKKGDSPGSLACLSVRFALEFDADSSSRDVACKQVERHMRLCLAATTGFERLITLAGSEPLLAEAASQIMRGSGANPVRHLANHSDLHCVDRGRRGELVAALIIMQARDAAVAAVLPRHRKRWVSVNDFMQALLPEEQYIKLQCSLPTSWRAGEDRLFADTFQDYAMWFNHVIRIEKDKLVNAEYLWSFVTRGAMILCTHNQNGVDIVIPLCLKTGKLSRKTVSAILIQVKNSDKYGYVIDRTLFDALCPFRVRLFDEGSTPRPVIRMVFALASSKSGVHSPEVRERPRTRHYDDSTAFDIWCAGLSSFKNIDEDLASYQILLDRSLQPHDAFELGEFKNDEFLDAATRKSRGCRRRRMAALTLLHEEHHQLHL